MHFKFWKVTSVKSNKIQLTVIFCFTSERFASEIFLFNEFTQTLWPKSVNCGKSFWSAFPEMLSEIFFSEGISRSNCRFSDLLFGTNFKNSYFDKNISNYLQIEFLELFLCWFHRFNLYNFFFERFIWKMIGVLFLWFDCWTLKEWKTAKAQNHSVSPY